MRLIILQLLVGVILANDLGYSQASVYNCKEEFNYTEAQERQVLRLFPLDKYILVILGPIAAISCSFIIATFILFPSCRKSPGDILLAISICDLVNSIYLMISGWYAIIHDDSPEPLGSLCQTLGVISVMCFMGDYLYNIFFSFSPIMYVSQTLSKKPTIYKVTYHVFTIATMLTCGITAYLLDYIYLNLAGLCFIANYKRASQGLLRSLTFSYLLIVYIICAGVSVIQFKRVVPKSETLKDNRKKFLNYYQKFVIATTIIYTVNLALSFINKLNCFYFQNRYLNISLTLFNLMQVLTPIVNNRNIQQHFFKIQSFIRSQDPILRRKIRKLFNSIISSQAKVSDSLVRTDTQDFKDDFLGDIQSQLRTTQVYSLLAGILLMRQKQKHASLELHEATMDDSMDQLSRSSKSPSTIELVTYKGSKSVFFSEEDTLQNAQLVMDDKLVKQTLANHLPQYQAIKMKVTFYSPSVFYHLLQQDYPMVDLEESLDLIKNSAKILKFAGPNGGKSGEFFYFSHDNRIIIKTMQNGELIAIRKRMQSYGNYLINNGDSLISKLYGVYTFERLGVCQIRFPKVNILIQRNISFGIPREYILRTYDMKGSEYDREVLKKSSNVDVLSATLKDLDFFKLEEKIWIDSKVAKQMVRSLSEDAKFFREQRLIDYSLLVFKVDWGKYLTDNRLEMSQIMEHVSNNLYMVESSREQGIYYHIAVIDYLQEWNINKGVEQATKKLINLNVSLDTSAQNPDVYGERFVKKLIERILVQE